MRMWHYKLLPYLPDYQLKGQLRELIAIMHNWRDKGSPKSVIIDIIKEYPKDDFLRYFEYYCWVYSFRYHKPVADSWKIEFVEFCFGDKGVYDTTKYNSFPGEIFKDWHNKEYLRVCMANLYEKYKFGRGKSKISEEDWKRLLNGYKEITHEEYKL